MTVLLDTHALLWFVVGDARLPHAVRDVMTDSASRLLLSDVSVWEIAIKCSLGKIQLGSPPAEWLARRTTSLGLERLPIERSHVLAVADLPFHHRDPFDRLLVAQALHLGVPLASSDGPPRPIWRPPSAVTLRSWSGG